jgi:hypothetical protein
MSIIRIFLLVVVLSKESGVSKLIFRVDLVLRTHSFLALTQNTIDVVDLWVYS